MIPVFEFLKDMKEDGALYQIKTDREAMVFRITPTGLIRLEERIEDDDLEFRRKRLSDWSDAERKNIVRLQNRRAERIESMWLTVCFGGVVLFCTAGWHGLNYWLQNR